MLTVVEKTLATLLKDALKDGKQGDFKEKGSLKLSEQEWKQVCKLAKAHKVLSLCYQVLKVQEGFPESCFRDCERISRQIVYCNYRLLFLTRFVISVLKENKIDALVLKGSTTALLYPVPELRKSGDVDLLLASEAVLNACSILEKRGFCIKECQAALHHVGLISREGITVELHGMLAEPFDNSAMNQYLEALAPEMLSAVIQENGWGVAVPALPDGYHAYYLLIHMLQHFLRYGFGLKYLCDWVVFWNRKIEANQQETFLRLVRESGVLGFARMITAVCVQYLGLEEEKAAFLNIRLVSREQRRELLREVMEAGEFGKAQKERMVVVRGGRITGFVREFHHQMHLRFPNAGKNPLLWPVLWWLTFYRFCRNNRTLRKISATAILRKASKRSSLVRQMDLFHMDKP